MLIASTSELSLVVARLTVALLDVAREPSSPLNLYDDWQTLRDEDLPYTLSRSHIVAAVWWYEHETLPIVEHSQNQTLYTLTEIRMWCTYNLFQDFWTLLPQCETSPCGRFILPGHGERPAKLNPLYRPVRQLLGTFPIPLWYKEL